MNRKPFANRRTTRSLLKNKPPSSHLDDGRLGSLPDNILARIISYLDTKSAFRTSILSKRYRFLWKQLQNLCFVLPNPNPLKGSRVYGFQSFVDYVLQYREDSNLNSFRLVLGGDSIESVTSEFLETCIGYAVANKVQHLRIRVALTVHSQLVMLPRPQFTCCLTLVTLRLNNNQVGTGIELPKCLFLPKLRSLRLRNFEFCEDNYNGELITGCPNLENLVLNKCYVKLEILEFVGLKLQNFEIRNWRSPSRLLGRHHMVVVNLDAPGLVFFKLQGSFVKVNFKEGYLPCLNTAYLDVRYPSNRIYENERGQIILTKFMGMLPQLCNVEFLSLSLSISEVMSSKLDILNHSPVVFENLRSIKFTVENKCSEATLPVETVRQAIENVTDGMLTLITSEEGEPSLSHVRKSRKKSTVGHLPANTMHYLLKCFPSLQSITIETSEVSKGKK